MKTITTIILAGGIGARANTNKPKQYMQIDGVSILRKSVLAFLNHKNIDTVQVVIGKTDIDAYNNAVGDLNLPSPVFGGNTRCKSTQSGLNATDSDYVLIHDSARPFIDTDTISRVIDGLNDHDAVVPCINLVDSLKTLDGKAVDRDNLKSVQTPQGFKTEILKQAYKNGGDFTDNAGAVENICPIHIVQGNDRNIKMTTEKDFAQSSSIEKNTTLSAENNIVQKMPRVGYGYDVHAFKDGDFVTLCGIKVPHNQGFLAHSDGDVAMHALTDAIYGALADGDIGQHFPPSDMQWSGASSDIFLKHAISLLKKRGATLCNADITIVCEQPKIGIHRDAMRAILAQIMNISIDNIAVKATTSEQLGFTGRGEGIATHATVMILI